MTVIPMGGHPVFGGARALERDVDVVFLGSTRDSRRARLIRDLETALMLRGLTFVVKDGTAGRGYAFAEERTVLLNRAKIMLNVMRQPWDDPVFRVLLAAPNGAMVLSERVRPESMGPFREDIHLALADVQKLPEAIEYYIREDGERQRITRAAHEFVTADLTMSKMVGQLLRVIGV